MEKLSLENIDQQCREMWDAISHIPYNDPDLTVAVDNARETEAKLRDAYRKQEALRDAAPELLDVLKFIVNYFRSDIDSDTLQEINKTIAKAEGRE